MDNEFNEISDRMTKLAEVSPSEYDQANEELEKSRIIKKIL